MSLPTAPQSRAGMPPQRARVLVGASAKVGKTTLLGAWAPTTTLIVDTHYGTALLDGEHYVSHVRDWPSFVGVVDDICASRHAFTTIGLDLVGDLWRYCDLYYGRKKDGLTVPASAMDDYGRSSTKARAAFNAQIGRLLAAPVGIWLLTHLREKTNKEGDLVVYAPDMDKSVHGYLMGAVDFVWLAEVDRNGKRIVHTQPTQHFEAGSRVSLPSPLSMDARALWLAMDRGLNPHLYTPEAIAARKAAKDGEADAPANVPPAPVAAGPTPQPPEPPPPPPERKDPQPTGKTDIPAEDPWFADVQPMLKGIPSAGLRAAVVAAGGEVPEHVSSWKATILALDAEQRKAFVKALEALRWESDPMPWDGEPDAPEADDPGGQLDMADARAEATA